MVARAGTSGLRLFSPKAIVVLVVITIGVLILAPRCSRSYFDEKAKAGTIERFNRAPIEGSYLRDLINRAHPVAFNECYEQVRVRVRRVWGGKLDMSCYRDEVLRTMIALAVKDGRNEEAEELRKFWMGDYRP